MTLDEAIKHAEEVAEEQDKLCKRYDDASGYTRSHNEDIRSANAKKCVKCADEHRQFVEWLKELKQLREQTRWISVSEKLPNDRDWYLGIFKEPDTGWINPLPFVCDYAGRETKATTKEYWILRGFTDRDEHIDYYFNLECVKWMPLQQNYEEVEE